MKLVIITGVSRGIGKALAENYLNRGWKVIGIGRNSSLNHPNYEWKKCDLADSSGIDSLEISVAGFQEVLLINNAGVLGTVNRLSDQKTQDNKAVFQINVLAPMELTKKLAQLCGEVLPLTVLNISSGAGRRPIASWSYYCASKAALDMFSQCFQLEEREKGRKTKVYALAPGVIASDMQVQIRSAQAADFSASKQFHDLYHDKQLQSVEEVAEKIVRFLESNLSDEVISRL